MAFEHDLAGGRIKPLLTNIRLFGVVTTYGSPWWLARLLAGDPGRKVLMRGLKPMCGPGVRSFYLTHYDMDRSTPGTRQGLHRARPQRHIRDLRAWRSSPDLAQGGPHGGRRLDQGIAN